MHSTQPKDSNKQRIAFPNLHSIGPPFSHCVKAKPSCGCDNVTHGSGVVAPTGAEEEGLWQNTGAAVKFAEEGGACTCAISTVSDAAAESICASSKREMRGMEWSIVEPKPGDATAARTPRACSHRCITLHAMSAVVWIGRG